MGRRRRGYSILSHELQLVDQKTAEANKLGEASPQITKTSIKVYRRKF